MNPVLFEEKITTKDPVPTQVSSSPIKPIVLKGLIFLLALPFTQRFTGSKELTSCRFDLPSSIMPRCEEVFTETVATCLCGNMKTCPDFQKHVNEQDWSYKVSTYPPRPRAPLEFDREKTQAWIDLHKPQDQAIAKKFLTSTTVISQESFERSLQNSVASFNHWLDWSPSNEYVVFANSEKSTYWTFQLALPYLTKLPQEIFIDYSPTSGPFSAKPLIHSKQKDSFDHHTFVIFEDASYSGSQAFDVTTNILTSLDIGAQKKLLTHSTFNFIWVMPYITQEAYKEIMKLNEIPTQLFKLNIRIFSEHYMTQLSDHLSQQECEQVRISCSKTPWIFDHKISDFVSSYPYIYELGCTLPLYMRPVTCESLNSNSLHTGPKRIPPYKKIIYKRGISF